MGDRYRFQHPETSRPIELSESFQSSHSRARSDRKPTQTRPFFLKVGLVSEARGSAYIETGNHKVICSVHGPNPFRKDFVYEGRGRLNVDVRFAPGALPTRRLNQGKEVESSSLSRQVHQAIAPSVKLETFPKSVVDINVVILECDAPVNSISSEITAVSAALADARIEMIGLVIGTSIMYKTPQEKFTDPTWCESIECKSLVSCSIIPAMGSVSNLRVSGDLPPTEILSSISEMVSTAEAVHGILRNALVESEKS